MSDRLPYSAKTYLDASGPRHCIVDAKGKLIATLEPGQSFRLAESFAAVPDLIAACEHATKTLMRAWGRGEPT